MKIIVDHTLCEGHGKCMDLLPEVFEVGDDDRSRVRLTPVPETLREQVERVARVCPRAAIRVES